MKDKISHPLINFKGAQSSWYMEGEQAFNSIGFSMVQYIGLLALQNGGELTFRTEDLIKVHNVRIIWDETGQHIAKVIVPLCQDSCRLSFSYC